METKRAAAAAQGRRAGCGGGKEKMRGVQGRMLGVGGGV